MLLALARTSASCCTESDNAIDASPKGLVSTAAKLEAVILCRAHLLRAGLTNITYGVVKLVTLDVGLTVQLLVHSSGRAHSLELVRTCGKCVLPGL